MNYIEHTRKDLQTERALLKGYEKSYSELPDGRLVCKRIKGRLQYYHLSSEGEQTYLGKDKMNFILDLRQKKRLKIAIKRLKKNIHIQEKIISQYREYDPFGIEKDLPFTYSDEALMEWSKAKYRQNPLFLEYKIHRTSFGLMVRSKSEVIIAELLYAMGIPFRYDAEIKLKDEDGNIHIKSPDFIIMTPTGELIVWEHWGLFVKEDYREQNYPKLELYFQNDYILSQNLIITMDTKERAIDAETVRQVIEGQLLWHFS